MSDGSSEDTRPLPRRTLAGAGDTRGQRQQPLTERLSAAIASAEQPVQTSSGSPDRSSVRADSSTRGNSSNQATAPAAVKPIGQPFDEVTGRAGQPVRDRAATQSAGKKPAQQAATKSKARSGRVRRARLRITHIDPWSVMKTAFLLSVAVGIVTVVAVAVVWGVLGVAGVWDSINKAVMDVVGDPDDTFDIRDYLGTNRVMGFTMIVAVVDVVLITAMATLGAFLYNLAAALLGGLDVTLTEDE